MHFRLPNFTISLLTKKREIEAELAALPPTYEDDAQAILVEHCANFFRDIDEHLNGYESKYHERLRPFFILLKAKIEATKPKIENVLYARGKGIF